MIVQKNFAISEHGLCPQLIADNCCLLTFSFEFIIYFYNLVSDWLVLWDCSARQTLLFYVDTLFNHFLIFLGSHYLSTREVILQLTSFRTSDIIIHTINRHNYPLNRSFVSLWPENFTCETSDDYEDYESIHRQQEQQTILKHQEQGEEIENKSYNNKTSDLAARQMVDNINNSNDQRLYSRNGGANGTNNDNTLSRRKISNGKITIEKKIDQIEIIFLFSKW